MLLLKLLVVDLVVIELAHFEPLSVLLDLAPLVGHLARDDVVESQDVPRVVCLRLNHSLSSNLQ